MKFVVVGGGSAGWMSAATLASQFPKDEIVVIEPATIPPIGVGESTINDFVDWLNLLGINPESIMKETDAIFKLAIKFVDFKEKGHDFFYPFGSMKTPTGDRNGNIEKWSIRRTFKPEDAKLFVDAMYPTMSLVRHNTFMRNTPNFPWHHYALHFDAIKFAIWLRENYCKPRGVKRIVGEVAFANTNSDGITSLILKDSQEVSGDLYLDCTGFKSLLLGGAMQEPYKSFKDILPNEFAWATQIPYVNKKEELKPYTTCTAIENGWVWNIPLWSRMGSGYVYSDEFISHDQALDQFKQYLTAKGQDVAKLQFKKIQFKSGTYERVWVKNVVGIGLAGGFIEPLESSGLWTTHTYLTELVKVISVGNINEFNKSLFNKICVSQIREFAEFVHSHYIFSKRRDTEYWRKIASQPIEFVDESYYNSIYNGRMNPMNTFANSMYCIASGMGFHMHDDIKLKSTVPRSLDVDDVFGKTWKDFDDMYKEWDTEAKKAWPMFELLRRIHEINS